MNQKCNQTYAKHLWKLDTQSHLMWCPTFAALCEGLARLLQSQVIRLFKYYFPHISSDARVRLVTKVWKVTVSLHLDLGDPPPPPGKPHDLLYHQRNSPSQQRSAARLAGQAGPEEVSLNDIVSEKAVENTTKNNDVPETKPDDQTAEN